MRSRRVVETHGLPRHGGPHRGQVVVFGTGNVSAIRPPALARAAVTITGQVPETTTRTQASGSDKAAQDRSFTTRDFYGEAVAGSPEALRFVARNHGGDHIGESSSRAVGGPWPRWTLLVESAVRIAGIERRLLGASKPQNGRGFGPLSLQVMSSRLASLMRQAAAGLRVTSSGR